jgi:hypothetical protein
LFAVYDKNQRSSLPAFRGMERARIARDLEWLCRIRGYNPAGRNEEQVDFAGRIEREWE